MMNKRRIEFLNETRIKISQLKNSIKRDTEGLNNIKNLSLKKEDMDKRKELLLSKIDQKGRELLDLEEKENEILDGNCDDEIKKTIIANPKKTISLKTDKVVLKPDFQFNPKIENKEHVDDGKNKKERKKEKQERKDSDRKEYLKKYDSENYFKNFCHAIDSLPRYISKNLSNMPNNKGYIWKGCWFFGELPIEKNEPTVMFEKAYNQNLKIYVISKTEIVVSEKGNNEKKHIETIQRKIIL